MAATLELRLTTGGLGGAATAAAVSATALNNIFDNVSAAEAAAGDTEYRAVDIYNTGDATAVSVAVYMSTETTSASTQLDMGIDASPIDSTVNIVDESTAPAGVTPAHKNSASKLSIPDIPAGSYARLWLKRIVSAAAPNTANDQGTISVDYA